MNILVACEESQAVTVELRKLGHQSSFARMHQKIRKIQKQKTKIKGERKMENTMNGKYVIVRGDRSGVFAGELAEMNGKIVTLKNCRRLWYWEGACSDFQIAKDGVTKPGSCKFTVTVDEITIIDAIEVIPTTKKAERIIKEVPEWKK